MKIKIPQFLRLGNLVYNKRFTVILSLVLAFAMWVGITMTENPIRTQTFTDVSAAISIENTAASELGLGIVSDIAAQKFTVTVSGPNYIVSSLKSDDFVLSASLADINSAGTYNLEIIGTRNSSKSGYTFTTISPSTVDVVVDYIDVKEFTVTPKLVGVSAASGLVAETPVVVDSQQSTVTVKGPRTVIDKIESVETVAEVNETLDASQNFDTNVVLYDSNGKVIYRYATDGTVYDSDNNIITNSYLTLSYTSAKVLQPISKKATVPCKAVFTNLPDGMSEKDISYKINHNSVTIIGTPEIVDKIENVTLSAIDFRKISSTENKEANIGSSFEVSANLPDGVKLLDSIDYFTVDVDVSGYQEKTFDIKNIRCTGVASGLTAKTDARIRNVKICGPAEIVNNITATDLYAVVDLTDKTAGDYTVEVTVKSDVYKNIWQVGSYSTSIKLSE